MRSLVGRRIEFVSLVFDGQDKIAWTDRVEVVIAEGQDRMAFHVAEMPLAPGRYRGRLVVRDMDSGESGVSMADLVVKNSASSGLTVDTPLILADGEPPSYWGRAEERGLRNGRSVMGSTPFVVRPSLAAPRGAFVLSSSPSPVPTGT